MLNVVRVKDSDLMIEKNSVFLLVILKKASISGFCLYWTQAVFEIYR